MRNIVIIAAKEIKEGLRNRWVLATTLLLAALSLSLTFLGSAPTGNVGAGALDVVVVSLSSLTIFLLPLIALLISHDAGWYRPGEPGGGRFRGFEDVYTTFVPALREARWTASDIHQLMVSNPAAAFTVGSREAGG